MPRLLPVVLAIVLAHVSAAAITAADTAWVIVVDDLHVSFVQTGGLRQLLRAMAAELIEDGDRYLFRASGPSALSLSTSTLTDDREFAVSAIKVMTGNALKDADVLAGRVVTSPMNEELYRANIALDALGEGIFALTREPSPHQAIIMVSTGYDIETYPALAERVRALGHRARENNITIFAIDASGFEALPLPDPPASADALQRYRTATRRSLSMMVEESGGFVLEKPNTPGPELAKIGAQMSPRR